MTPAFTVLTASQAVDYQGYTEGVGFEPTVRLPVRLISSQVPSTNSATLPLSLNQGREDSVNCRLVDDLVTGLG